MASHLVTVAKRNPLGHDAARRRALAHVRASDVKVLFELDVDIVLALILGSCEASSKPVRDKQHTLRCSEL